MSPVIHGLLGNPNGYRPDHDISGYCLFKDVPSIGSLGTRRRR